MENSNVTHAPLRPSRRTLSGKERLILLSGLGVADFTVISLYQTGLIRRLPDIPHPLFDSNKVNTAPLAYILGVPDGPLGAAAYASTIVLAANQKEGAGDKATATDWLLGGVIAGNAAGAALYLYDMVFVQKKACLYCLMGAAINFASVGLVRPVWKRIWKSLSHSL